MLSFRSATLLGCLAVLIAGLMLASLAEAQTPAAPKESATTKAAEGISYTFVNKTNGKWKDEECFWSLDHGKTWHSFAAEPTVPCPKGNGRVYFYVGKPPKNLGDRTSYWDFIEYASDTKTWHGNTTQVDAFGIPLTIEMGNKRVGITKSRSKLFEDFAKNAPEPFKACVKGDFWIVSPASAGMGKNGPNANYFDKYVEDVWAMYAAEKKTPSGKWIGKVTDGALTFTPVAGGKSVICKKKPTTQEILMGTGVLATNPQFCAAANRHVLEDPADWNTPTKFYQAEPCNWYSKFLHENSIDNKAYGFCYDDASEQAAFFSATGKTLLVTLYWG